MEEKDRQRMEKEYNRLEQWIVKLERIEKSGEHGKYFFFDQKKRMNWRI